jgi:hypothetical protein
MRSGCCSNANADQIYFEFKTDTNKQIVDSHLIVSQLYNDIIHIILPSLTIEQYHNRYYNII